MLLCPICVLRTASAEARRDNQRAELEAKPAYAKASAGEGGD